MKQRPKVDVSAGGMENGTDPTSTISNLTQQLRSAYQDIQKKSEELNRKLNQTNLELKQDLAERDKISYYLNCILRNLSTCVVAVDLGGKIVAFNPPAEKILERKAEQMMGKSYDEIFGQVTPEKHNLPYLIKSGQDRCHGKKQITTGAGERITVNFQNSLLRDTEGELFGAVEMFTKSEEPEDEEGRTTRLKNLAALGEMAAIVAHEIKNPLGGIRGFAELLDRDLKDGDPRKKSVKKIIEGVDALNKTVAAMLDQTKPVKLNLKRVEMVNFTEEAINFFEMDSANKRSNVRIIKAYPPKELNCDLDTEQFRQAVLNILRNAIQAMPNGGEVKIQLSRTTDGKVMLKISDTGIGMSQETQKKIFTPFYTTKEGGTGLGLLTVKKMVEAHGGDIRLESEAGKGTTVIIELPAFT